LNWHKLLNVFYILHDLDKSPEVDKSFIDLINLFVDDDIEILGDFDENKGDNYNTPSSNWDYDSSTGIKELDDDDSTFTLKEKFNKFVFGSSKNGTDNNFQNHTNDRTKPINNDDNKKFEKFTSKDFYEYFKNYKFYKTEGNNISFNDDENKFKTKNATLIVEINNKKKVFDKITFSLGGSLSRTFAKPGYNLKIRGGKELFGRRQFKLRSDFTDPTYMRTKLVSDIRNRIGIPSLSANYVTLCINDEYLGLFILTDLYKQSWIEYVYGEKNTELLYKCNQCYLNFETRSGFKNENKEASNVKELYEFLAEMTKAKSASDIESIFDLDLFYKNIAVDFLVSSWDHIFHNYCIYKNKINNKWIYLSYDFDLDMGRNVEPTIGLDIFSESPILEKLISNDNSYFKEAIIEIVSKVFNPAVLFPHIDEIKSFIRPFVELDKTPDEKGQYPGRLNKFGSGLYSFEQWEDSIEFKEANEGIYSLKKFILLRYRIICHDYDLECDPIYLDNNYENSFTITSNLSIDEDDYNDIMDALDDDEEFLCDPIYIAKHYEELFNTTDISFDESNKKIEKTVNDFENNEDFTKHEDF